MAFVSTLSCAPARLADQRAAPRLPRLGRAAGVQCSAVPKRKQPNDKAGKAQALKTDVEEAAVSSGGASGLETLTKLAGMLLNNAASLREPRGVAHCLRCKGTGTCKCENCKGKGVLPSNKVQRHSVRRMVSQLEELVGKGSPVMHDNDWQMSNRCMKCHGTGRCLCAYCQGAGARGARGISR